MAELRDRFGAIDIYLFDQLLRGRIRPGMRILDAGCGNGRNSRLMGDAGATAVVGLDAGFAEIGRAHV